MYVLTYDNQVFIGPKEWHPRFFTSVIEQDYDMFIDFGNTPATAKIILNEHITVWPAVIKTPAYDAKYQYLGGPYFNFTDTECLVIYTEEEKDLNQIKQEFYSIIADNRWKAEVGGTTTTLQGKQVKLNTDREGRNIFLQAYQLGSNGATWKFDGVNEPVVWLSLSNAELGAIVQTIMMHVQGAFDWESSKVGEVASCSNVDMLKQVDLSHG